MVDLRDDFHRLGGALKDILCKQRPDNLGLLRDYQCHLRQALRAVDSACQETLRAGSCSGGQCPGQGARVKVRPAQEALLEVEAFIMELHQERKRPEAINKTNTQARAIADPEDPLLMPETRDIACLLYTSPSPRDKRQSRMPSSA